MRKLKLIIAALFLMSPFAASATLIQIDVEGVVSDPSGAAYIPVGTVVNASVQMDVTGSGWPPPLFTSVGGMVTWNDGTARTFNATNVSNSSASSLGSLGYSFFGTGPMINGYSPDFFRFVLDIGTNPFTAADTWEDLFLGSTVLRGGLGARLADGSGFACDCIGEIRSFSISTVSVPEPSTLALLGIGLLGMGAARRRKKA